MKHSWTLEKLSALSSDRLENLRQNALRAGDAKLAGECSDLQQSRKPGNANGGRSEAPVVGFHFVCDNDYEVIPADNGRFWSGVWAVDQSHCDPAIAMRGYVALHETKRQNSYRQGYIVGWEVQKRSKGTTAVGVSFLLQPFEQPMRWYGHGAGEKGYRRTTDSPPWNPDY